ncbi:MAG TPA: hypothetical protein VFK80_04755 [Limnochordia bacterium]|nr:hypothetical protein [Limnochordia bacterium]
MSDGNGSNGRVDRRATLERARAAKEGALRRLRRLKMGTLLASALGFGGVAGLAAAHSFGTGTASAAPQTDSVTGDAAAGGGDAWTEAADRFFGQSDDEGGYAFVERAPRRAPVGRSRLS